jgi:ankyrin repeat protein
LVKEYAGFTPIMLAVAEGAQHIEAVRILLANKADTTILDTYGNNILHIAAHYQNIDAIEFLTLNSQKLNILERNQNGETPMSIVQDKKNERGIKILERFISVSGDTSKQNVDDLLNELDAEKEKQEKDRLKKKEKKYRHKVRQLAEKEGVTFEEMEKILIAEKAEKKKDEERIKKEEEEKDAKE